MSNLEDMLDQPSREQLWKVDVHASRSMAEEAKSLDQPEIEDNTTPQVPRV